MRALIISSSRNEIDPYYLSVARSIAEYLANNEYDLVYGAASSSMMGICYDSFSKKNRDIYAFTTSKYVEDLKNLNLAKHFIRETTFDLKKDMFNNSDLIICLPGGVGTYSELLTYMEEKRSNNQDKPIIIYDENKFYEKFLLILDDLIKEGFASKDILNTFILTTNKNEFVDALSDIRRVKKWKN